MIGTFYRIPAAGDLHHKQLDRPPSIDELQEAVGGYIEVIPFFDSIAYAGVVMHCVAFCNEDGKREALPINDRANTLWHRALERNGMRQLMRDQLVGPIAVVFGDRELMAEL